MVRTPLLDPTGRYSSRYYRHRTNFSEALVANLFVTANCRGIESPAFHVRFQCRKLELCLSLDYLAYLQFRESEFLYPLSLVKASIKSRPLVSNPRARRGRAATGSADPLWKGRDFS